MYTKCIAMVLGLVFVLSLSTPSLATTYYVSKSGNDSYDGRSWPTAWATVAKVNATISAGDVVYFMATDKWYGSQLTPPTGGDVDNQTYYISANTVTEYVPFGATICAGDSLGGGWSLYGTPSDSIYRRSYSPTLTTWDDNVSAVLQGGSADGDSLITAVGSLGAVDVPGELYYDNINNVIYVRLYNLDGKQHPDAYNTISCTAPSFYCTANTQRYIHSEGLNHECGAAGNIWFGFGEHSRHATIRDGWIRYGCNRLASANGALIASRRASDDLENGNPATITDIGMHNSVVACSLDYCADANSDQAWGIGMDVYSEWYLKIDSNYMGSHVNNTGFHFKGLYVYPPDASISNPGYQCSNNHIVCGDRISDAAIKQQVGTHYNMIYGNVIECNDNARAIWLYLDDDHGTPGELGSPIMVYNNTVYNQGQEGIAFGFEDDLVEGDTDIRVKYNLVWNIDDSRNAIKAVRGAYQCFTACDSNLYFDSTQALTFETAGGSGPTGYGSLSWWQSTYGYDTHSSTANPGFRNAAISDFSRPNAGTEMNLVYGGKQWTVWGAVQESEPCPDPPPPPPSPPAPVSPTNGASNLDQPILFDWSDVGDADLYQIQMDNNSDFSSPEATYQTSSSSQSVSGLSGTTTYFWRVRSYSNCGGWGNWSSIRSFSTADSGCDPPGPPTVMSPPNGASGVSQPVPINWNDVSGATLYNLQVDNNSDFSSTNVNVQPSVSQYSVPATLSPSTRYYWRVRSYNSCGWGGWSSTLYFTTAAGSGGDDTTPPTISNVHATDTTATTAQILWQTNEPATSQVVYVTGLTSPDSTNETTTFVLDHQNMLTGLYPNTTYEYCVKSADSVDNTSQSYWYYFRTAGFIVGADDAQIEILGEAVYHTSQPTLVVSNISASEENLYYFEVATDSNFVNSVAASQAVDQQTGGTTGWKVSSRLEEDRDYYWRASADFQQCSEVSMFRVQPKPHTYPDPFNPNETPFATFTDIPPGSTLKIKTLQGETVWTFSDNDKERIIWDGLTDYGKPAAAGVYIWIVEDTDIRGKLTVIR